MFTFVCALIFGRSVVKGFGRKLLSGEIGSDEPLAGDLNSALVDRDANVNNSHRWAARF